MLESHFTTLPSSCSVFCVLLTRKELACWETWESRAVFCHPGEMNGFLSAFLTLRAPFLLDGLLGFRAGESRVKSHAESLTRKPEFLSTAGGIRHGSPAESSGGEDNTQPSSARSLGSSWLSSPAVDAGGWHSLGFWMNTAVQSSV